MIRVGLLVSSSSAAGAPEEALNFTFTAASSAISDREAFKTELAALISRNRSARAEQQAARESQANGRGQQTPSAATGSPAMNGSKSGVDKGKGVDPTQDWRVKKRVLQNDPDLRLLHKELVIGGHISEGDFWEGREELLIAESMAENQRKGRSAQMVDPRPETTATGDISISVTPQMIHDIFEQYPIVQKAYSDNVPPLSDAVFWTRYFGSRLFHRHRSSARSLGDTAKDDEIFDRYLEADDDDLEPKNLQVRDVYRLLDLAATEEDHGETGNMRDWTMRAGNQRASLPLMRRFNEHSERLLDSALGKAQGRTVIDGGNAGERNLAAYAQDIVLEDLEGASAPDRILLDLEGQDRLLQGGSTVAAVIDDGDEAGGKKRKRTEEDIRELGRQVTDDLVEWVRGGQGARLEAFEVDDKAMERTRSDMLKNIRAKYEQRHGAKEEALPPSIAASLTSLHSATNEFLRHFWTAVLPPRPNDISASAAATPQQKAAKAQKMLGFLDRTADRVAQLEQDAANAGVAEGRVAEAVASVLRAVEKARKFYRERTAGPGKKA